MLTSAATRQDPGCGRKDIARRQQPRDEGVLSGAVDVRSDLSRLFERRPRLTLAIVEFELA